MIELPISDDLDVSGWDLRKALRLVSKSNPTLLESLHSPVVYRQDAVAVAQLRAISAQFYSPLGMWWHYFNMAKSNYRGYLRGERIRTKKYLYVLRPILACQWIERRQDMPPMAFEVLLDALLPNGELRQEVDRLLALKRVSTEVEDGPRIAAISDFLEAELDRMGATQPRLSAGSGRADALDTLFRQMLAADAASI